MRRQLVPALRMLVVATVVLGLLYPLAMTGIAQAIFPSQADGSPIRRDGEVVGSERLGQAFTGVGYFHTRPSAAGSLAAGALVQDVDEAGNPVGDPYPADPSDSSLAASGASNQGPTNPDLLAAIQERAEAYRDLNGLDDDVAVPIDAVTTSGSGVDPHISMANARLQVGRVASERSLDPTDVQQLVEEHVDERSLGFLGENGVRVVELNLALDELDQ